MRSTSIGAALATVLTTVLLLTACVSRLPGPKLPPGAEFVGEVALLACRDNAYVGKSTVETLALATTFTSIATTGYHEGIVKAQEALALQRLVNTSMIQELNDIRADTGLGALFTSFAMLDVNAAAVDEVAREIRERYTNDAMPEPVAEAFQAAARSLHIANRFQVEAGLGVALLAGSISDMRQAGGRQELARIMVTELGNDGGRQLLDSMLGAPGTVGTMVLNLGELATLGRTLEQVADFSIETEALQMLGIADDISELEAAAQAKARELRSRYPEELAYRPSGQTMRAQLVSALTRSGVNNHVASLAVSGLALGCGGLFNDTAMPASEPVQGGADDLAGALAQGVRDGFSDLSGTFDRWLGERAGD